MHVYKLLCICSLVSFKCMEIRNEGLTLQMNHALRWECESDKIHNHHDLNHLPTCYNICTEI